MHRTTVMLPDDLKHAAQVRANERGISLGELIRESLSRRLESAPSDGFRDPLFLDAATYSDNGPSDLTERHDDYLYGDPER